MTWSSRGREEKCGILFAHSTSVNSCLSAAWQMLVTGSFGCRDHKMHGRAESPSLLEVVALLLNPASPGGTPLWFRLLFKPQLNPFLI